MKKMTRYVGIGIMLVGVAFAGWGPMLFGGLTGAHLPEPRAADLSAMSTWSGLALLRTFGAALMVLGALLMAMSAPRDRGRMVYRALGLSALVGLILTVAQTIAIWTNPLSLLIAVPFAAAALLGMRGGWFGAIPIPAFASGGRRRSAPR